jgi:hypothetical protein
MRRFLRLSCIVAIGPWAFGCALRPSGGDSAEAVVSEEEAAEEALARDAAGALLEEGFVPLFNGADLTGWEGDPRIWSVAEGAIAGRTTEEVRVRENDFLIWKGGQPESFDLRLRFKLVGGNSGIYFHAERRLPGGAGEPLVGPQADISADGRWTGVLMEYTKREVLAERGEKVHIDSAGKREVIGQVGDPAQLLAVVKGGEWNDYRVIVDRERVLLEINGVVMCDVTDRDPRRTPRGHLALQVHTGPPMTVQFKDLYLKEL